MVCKINGAMICGIEACPVTVETDISDGLPSFDMVGLLSSEVREARERVRTALKNSGFYIPAKRITINFAPADIRKSGTCFDLPVAVSILTGLDILPEAVADGVLFTGELSLSGQAVGVNGVLPMVIMAKEQGYKTCFVPMENLGECAMVGGIDVIGVRDLKHLLYILNTGDVSGQAVRESKTPDTGQYTYDFKDIKGQKAARRAAEISAAGMHHMLLIGSPGSGKTMIARCMPSILPDMTEEEKLEVAKIKSVAGDLKSAQSLTRPFRSPHHTSTVSALAGGGFNPKPGEITLAHNGVLFLDEFPEFPRSVIEVLREPLEEGSVSVSRAGGKYRFPADFVLLAACNIRLELVIPQRGRKPIKQGVLAYFYLYLSPQFARRRIWQSMFAYL